MKKILMTMAAAFVAVTMSAQVYLGGSIGVASVKDSNADAETLFKIVPEVGYNINDKWAVGVDLEFGMANELVSIKDGANATGTDFGLGAYARYTFAQSGPVSFFVDGGLSYISTNYNISQGVKYDESGSVFNIGLRPGLAFKASDKVSFVATTGYLGYRKNSDDVLGGGSKFGINVNNEALKFGFYYNF